MYVVLGVLINLYVAIFYDSIDKLLLKAYDEDKVPIKGFQYQYKDGNKTDTQVVSKDEIIARIYAKIEVMKGNGLIKEPRYES